MNTPVGVTQAVAAVWVTIVLSALVALYGKLTGVYSEAEFMFHLVISGICCIVPYKLSNGSNAMRYFYLVLIFLSVFMVIAGVGFTRRFDYIASGLTVPIEIFAVVRLFQPGVSAWFTRER